MNLHDLIQTKHDLIAVNALIESKLEGASESQVETWTNIMTIITRSIETIGELQSDNEALSSQLRSKSLKLAQLEVEYDMLQKNHKQLIDIYNEQLQSHNKRD